MWSTGLRNPYVDAFVRELWQLEILWGSHPRDLYYTTARHLLLLQYPLKLVDSSKPLPVAADEMRQANCLFAVELSNPNLPTHTEPYYIPVILNIEPGFTPPTYPQAVRELTFLWHGYTAVQDEIIIAAIPYLAQLKQINYGFRRMPVHGNFAFIHPNHRAELDSINANTYTPEGYINGMQSLGGYPLQLILGKSALQKEAKRVLAKYIGLPNGLEIRRNIRQNLSVLVNQLKSEFAALETAQVYMDETTMNSDDSPVVNVEVHVDAFNFVIHIELVTIPSA